MKSTLRIMPLLAIQALLISCTSSDTIKLFNGENLDNWIVYAGQEEHGSPELFTVRDGVIHCTGKPNGYIRTKEEYSDFMLHLEWRWAEQPTNSGVLLHVGQGDRIWPPAIECQLMHEHAGDIVLIGQGTGITVGDSVYRVSSAESPYLVIQRTDESSEKEPGQWNSYDITSLDGDLEVVVNGILQNTGREMTQRKGHILLQSEGSAIEFRNIYLKRLP